MDVSAKKGVNMKMLKDWHSFSQSLKTGWFTFTALVKAMTLRRGRRTARPNTLRSSLYRRCSETPLSVFIKVLVSRDLSCLIRKGSPSLIELSQAWEDLFSEYSDLLKAPKYQYLLSLSREIGQLSTKLLTIRTCVYVLSYRHSEKAISILAGMGYKGKFDRSDMVAYTRSLESISMKSKAVEVSLEQRRSEYAKATMESGKNVSDESFIEVLLDLSKFMGFQVKADQITVLEYVSMLKKYEKWAEVTSAKAKRK